MSLFITRVFNPVHPNTCNKLTALSALLRLLNALVPLWRYRIYIESLINTRTLKKRCALAARTEVKQTQEL